MLLAIRVRMWTNLPIKQDTVAYVALRRNIHGLGSNKYK